MKKYTQSEIMGNQAFDFEIDLGTVNYNNGFMDAWLDFIESVEKKTGLLLDQSPVTDLCGGRG